MYGVKNQTSTLKVYSFTTLIQQKDLYCFGGHLTGDYPCKINSKLLVFDSFTSFWVDLEVLLWTSVDFILPAFRYPLSLTLLSLLRLIGISTVLTNTVLVSTWDGKDEKDLTNQTDIFLIDIDL